MVCGLLLLNVSSTVWAASHQPPGKSVASKKSPVVKKAPRTKAVKRRALPGGSPAVSGGAAPGLFGQASFYGKGFHGRRTSTGERFDARLFTAASNRFPLGTVVAVHRLDNDRCAIAKVNDRMHARHQRRVIDVSYGVADYLGMLSAGVVLVRVAPLKTGGDDLGQAICQAAFEPDRECLACAQVPRFPDFGELAPGQLLPAPEAVSP